MAWKFNALSETLSGLFYRTDDIAALIVAAGLKPAMYKLDGSANTVWTLLLKTVENQEKIPSIVEAALQSYPDNAVLLDYKNDVPVIRKSVYAGDTPEWKGGATKTQFEKITGTQSTLLPISFLETGLVKAKAVARILTPDGMGTGFLISADGLFLTNNHVFESAKTAGKSKVQFNYQKTVKGLPAGHEEFDVDNSLFETSVTDDWSLVRIKGKPAEKYGHLPLKTVTTPKKDSFVNIIQHPGGEFKQIGLYHNLVTFANDRIIQYLTDTLPGSSGSPVFNSEWDVVGLHHSGGWFEEPGTGKTVLRNEGININRIIDVCKAKGIAL